MDKLEDVYSMDYRWIEQVITYHINDVNINIFIKSPAIDTNSFLYCICICLNPNIITDSTDFINTFNQLIKIYNNITKNIKINELKHIFENNSSFPFNIIIFNIESSEVIIINSIMETNNTIYMIYIYNCYSLIKIYSKNNSIKYFDNQIYNKLKSQLQTNTKQLQNDNTNQYQDIISFQFGNNNINGQYLKNVIYHHLGQYRINLKINYRQTIGDGRCFINAVIMYLYKNIIPGTPQFNNLVYDLINKAENYIRIHRNKNYKFTGGDYDLNPDITDISEAIVQIIKKNIVIISDQQLDRSLPLYSGADVINIIGLNYINHRLLQSFDDVIYILGYAHHYTLLQFDSPHNNMDIFNFLLNKAKHRWFTQYRNL